MPAHSDTPARVRVSVPGSRLALATPPGKAQTRSIFSRVRHHQGTDTRARVRVSSWLGVVPGHSDAQRRGFMPR